MDIQAILDFLKKLQENNNKDWFHENKRDYTNARNRFVETVTLLISDISKFDSSIEGLETKHCIFRINRDVRFSKDKSPYKTNFGAYICKQGKKSGFGGYYLHIEPKNSFIAGGMYMPQPEILKAVRKDISVYYDEYKKIIEDPKTQKVFELMTEHKLKNVPRGFEKEDPAGEYLKFKSFIFMRPIKEEEINNFDTEGYSEIIKDYKLLFPLNNFLNKAVEFNPENPGLI